MIPKPVESVEPVEPLDAHNKKIDSETDECEEEAIRLAIKFNFVCDLTSMVIVENDQYVTKGPLGIGLKPFGVPTYVDYTSYYSSPADSIILSYDSGLPSFGARSRPNPNPNPNSNSHFNPSSIFFSLNSALQPAYDDFASYFSDDSDIYDEEGAVDYENESDTPTQNESDEIICKLTMYDQTYFRGRSEEITGDVELFDLNIGMNFDNAVASLKIEGNCCWSFFTEPNFQGESLMLQKGDYKSATQIKEIFKKASSVTSKC